MKPAHRFTANEAVAASFASGPANSDSGGSDSRLQRTLLQRGRQMLLVLDSLGEAADLAEQASRLHELSSLSGRRVVVTSRPAAWDSSYPGAARDDGPRTRNHAFRHALRAPRKPSCQTRSTSFMPCTDPTDVVDLVCREGAGCAISAITPPRRSGHMRILLQIVLAPTTALM